MTDTVVASEGMWRRDTESLAYRAGVPVPEPAAEQPAAETKPKKAAKKAPARTRRTRADG